MKLVAFMFNYLKKKNENEDNFLIEKNHLNLLKGF